MAKRGQPARPQIEIKQLNAEELETGIRKLRRRIEQVKALDPLTMSYDDARVRAAERDIHSDIIEIFGENSPEYAAHGYTQISHGEQSYMMGPAGFQRLFAAGIPHTVAMLEGLIARLEEKRVDLGADPASRIRAAFEGLELHPRIGDACADLYRDHHYRNAVLDAMIVLTNLVKEKSRKHDLDGAPLMRTVFSKNDPVLTFNDLKDQAEQDEQEGLMHLFEGAALALRNPRAHTLLDDSPELALDYIAMISMLAKRLDKATRRSKA